MQLFRHLFILNISFFLQAMFVLFCRPNGDRYFHEYAHIANHTTRQKGSCHGQFSRHARV